MDYKQLTNFAGKKFLHWSVSVAGTTHLNRNIYKWSCVFDSTRPFVLLQGSVHAREFVSSDVLMKMIDLIEEDFENLKDIGTPNLVVLPMINVDGVELVKHGINSVPKKMHDFLLMINDNKKDFSLFKANVRGVDINNNFDAKWHRQNGSIAPSISGFKGKTPASEKETKVLMQETILCGAVATISFHTKGNELYYSFYQKGYAKKRDWVVAKILSRSAGCKIKNVQRVSSGGFKDWCVEKLGVTAVTIELGDEELTHPIGEEFAENIFYKIKDMCYTLCEISNILGDCNEQKIYGASNIPCKKSTKKR